MKRDLVKVFIGENLSKVILLIVNVLLISMMTVSEYAKFTLLFSVTMLGSQLACAAIERLYIVDYVEFAPYAKSALFASLAICLVGVLIYIYASVTLIESMVVCGAMIATSLQQFRRIKYQQRQYFGFYAASDLIKSSIWFLGVVSVFYIWGQLTAIIALSVLIIASSVSLISMPRVPVDDFMAPKYNCAKVLRVLTNNLDVYVYTLLAAILPYMAVLLANQTENENLIATYGAAMRFQAITASIIQVFNVVFLPKISTAVAIGQGAVFLRSSLKKMPIMSVVLLMVIIFVSYLIPYVDGGKYPDAVFVYIVLSGCSWMSLISVSSINYLLANHAYRLILVAMVSGLMTLVISSSIFEMYSPKFGIAYASLLGYMVVSSFLLFCALRSSVQSDSQRAN